MINGRKVKTHTYVYDPSAEMISPHNKFICFNVKFTNENIFALEQNVAYIQTQYNDSLYYSAMHRSIDNNLFMYTS